MRRLLGPTSAIVGAGAFAVYPRHGESVSWISGNTDLLATALLLPALLVLLAPWRLRTRLALAFVLGGFAALSKESIYALPALAAVIVWAARDDAALIGVRRYAAGLREAALTFVVTLAAVLPIFFARQSIIGTAGGYEGRSRRHRADSDRARHTARRRAHTRLSSRSFVTAGSSCFPRSLPLFLSGASSLSPRSGEHRRLRVALAGLMWFGLSLVPAARLAVDLNTSNGERFLSPWLGWPCRERRRTRRARAARLAPARARRRRFGGCRSLAVERLELDPGREAGATARRRDRQSSPRARTKSSSSACPRTCVRRMCISASRFASRSRTSTGRTCG